MKIIPQHTLDKLNRETSRIGWGELHAFYQQGAVLVVAPGMDLVAVAGAMAEDDTAAIAQWLKQGQLEKASEANDAVWQRENTDVWAVVVAPWVLVQLPEAADE